MYDSYQFMSVESTLRSLLTNKHYVEVLLNDGYCSNMIKDCQDGKRYSKHPLLMDKTRFTMSLSFPTMA
jgi:hypothetical protein